MAPYREAPVKPSNALRCGTCDGVFFGSSCPSCRRHPDGRDQPLWIEPMSREDVLRQGVVVLQQINQDFRELNQLYQGTRR